LLLNTSNKSHINALASALAVFPINYDACTPLPHNITSVGAASTKPHQFLEGTFPAIETEILGAVALELMI
jgi:hypothetical protein